MKKIATVMTLCLTFMLTGCFGGGVDTNGKEFAAHGGTFNFLTMKWDLQHGLGTTAEKVAAANVPSGGRITNVNTNQHWKSMTFPFIIMGFWNEFIIGADYCQIGGTK